MNETPLCTILAGLQQLTGIDLVLDECPEAPTTARFTFIIVLITAIALLFR